MWYWIIVALLVSGLCRDVVCIRFRESNRAKRSWRGQKEEEEKNVGMNMKMSMRRKSARSSKREREAQAYAKDQRPKRKKRRWKIILEDIDSWEKYSFTFCDSVGIGRGKDGSMYERYLPLTSDGRISKLHCVIIHKNDKLYVKDRGFEKRYIFKRCPYRPADGDPKRRYYRSRGDAA